MCAPMIAVLVRLAQGCTDQIFSEDGLFTMRLVLRCARIEIKTERGGIVAVALELSQLTDVNAGNHHVSPACHPGYLVCPGFLQRLAGKPIAERRRTP